MRACVESSSRWGLLAVALLLFNGMEVLCAQGHKAQFTAAQAGLIDTPTAPVPVVPGQVIVRFRSGTSAARQQAILGGITTRWRKFPAGSALQRQNAGGNRASVFDQLAVAEFPPGIDATNATRVIRKHPEVLYAEPNYRVLLADTALGPVPDDFEFQNQWSFENTGDAGIPGADIHALEAWQFTTGNSNLVIAVIDTGADFFHPDLEQNIWTNPGEIPGNGIDDDGDGYIDDVHGYDFVSGDADPLDDLGHGSHVSGILAAVGNNHIGVAGVAWRASLMTLKAFDDTGNSDIAQVVEALRFAVQHGARIINASWGVNTRSRALEEVVQAAHDAGIVIVAAAGNENTDTVLYPAALDNVISVGATTRKDGRANFSRYGPTLDVAAPGEAILSTIINNRYDISSGTSMAAPHVAGVAALLLSRHPEFTNLEVENVLRNATDPINADQYIGSGRINAARAVAVNGPLPDAKLTLPDTLRGVTDLTGTAGGADFASYTVEYGGGNNPSTWTNIFDASISVTNGVLATGFDTSTLKEGQYTFRLTVKNTRGDVARDRMVLDVRNIQITYPLNNDILRAHDSIAILGTAFGSGISFRVQYGVGRKPAQWLENGIFTAAGGQVPILDNTLATWDTSQLKEDEFYTLRLVAQTASGKEITYEVPMINFSSHLRPGWPQYIPTIGEYPTEDWRQVVVADLDHDGHKELILVDSGNNEGKAARLLVYNYDGTLRWTKTLSDGPPFTDAPVAGDIDGDGFLEIFVDAGSANDLYAFRHDGTPLPGQWPVHLPVGNLGKALADVDGDGKPELVAFSNDSIGDEFGPRVLYVFDKTGAILRQWNVPGCSASVDAMKILPAVGNLDDEPDLEIVVPESCGQLAAYKYSQPDKPIWRADTFATVLASAAIGDLDGNGTNDVVVGAYDFNGTKRGGLHAFNNRGNPLPGWPVLLEESFAAPPALADFDGDGDLEICIPSRSSRTLHFVHHTGFEAPGWPIGPIDSGTAKSAFVVGDITGSGYPAAVMAVPGFMVQAIWTGDLSKYGGIRAWRFDGSEINLNQRQDVWPLIMESSGGESRVKAAPLTLTDIDGNGKLDIVSMSVQDAAYLPDGPPSKLKRRSSIYVWELDVPYTPEAFPWPELQGGARHAGVYETPPRPDLPPVIGSIPDQTIQVGGTFFAVELDRYVEDPDNRPDELAWSITGNSQLNTMISPQRIVTIAPRDANWLGEERLTFTVTDPAGRSSSRVVTFNVKLIYNPPIAAEDTFTLAEDNSVTITPLANDIDPESHPLQLLGVGRPAIGRVRTLPDGSVIYTPKANYNGPDEFSYTIGNGNGGLATGLVKLIVTPVPDPPTAVADQIITDEDTPVTFDPLANDSDPDGDSLTLDKFTQPQHGSVTMIPGGLLQYTPAPDYNGSDSFDYRIKDATGSEATNNVTFLIKPVNDRPTAQDQTFQINRNASQNITYGGGDVDPDELTFHVIQAPQHGDLLTFPTVATYTPIKGYVGPDSFTYTASDGQLDSLPATVSFNILDRNNPPATEDRSLATKRNQALTITLLATDVDDDPVTFQILSEPAHGTLSPSGTNYIYQPDHDYLGDDAFTFQATDGITPGRVTKISLKVTDQNTAPVAENQFFTIIENTPTNIVVTATDGEGDPLTYEILSPPLRGTLGGTPPNFTFSPYKDFVGPDRFIFKVSDGELESEPATVSLNIRHLNTPPDVNDQTITLLKNQPLVLPLEVHDVEGDPLHLPILKGPKYGFVYGLGTNLTYRPSKDFIGVDSFTYKAWDGTTYSKEARITLYVITEPDPPEFAIKSIDADTPDGVRLIISTPVGRDIRLEASTNLVNWVSIGIQRARSTQITFMDTNSVIVPYRYYRAVQVSGGGN